MCGLLQSAGPDHVGDLTTVCLLDDELTHSVTTALPTLGRVFNRADIAPWVGTAYLLTSTVSRPAFTLGKQLT